MSILIAIASPFRKPTGGLGRLQAEGRSVMELIEGLESRFPGMRGLILSEQGNILPHVNIYINDVDIKTLKGLETSLHPGDQVAIIPAIAGGC